MPRKPLPVPKGRISFAWWDDRDDRSPVFHWKDGVATTIVVEWPVDEEGHLAKERFYGGEFRVRRKPFSRGTYQWLVELWEHFGGTRHDLFVWDRSLAPAHGSLYEAVMTRPGAGFLREPLLKKIAEVKASLGADAFAAARPHPCPYVLKTPCRWCRHPARVIEGPSTP
jgi:hypothetical protein